MNRYSKTQLRRGATREESRPADRPTHAKPTGAAEEQLLLPNAKPYPGTTSLRKGARQ